MKSHPQIDFNPDTHTYRLKSDGKLIPGVSKILKSCGLIPSEIYKKHGQYFAVKGEVIHQTCALWLENDLDEDTLDESVKPYLGAFIFFLKTTRFKPASWEELVYNENLNYAGRYDIIGELNGKEVIIDIKTGHIPKTTGLQLALYDMATRAHKTPITYRHRFALQLKEDQKFKLVEYQDINDYIVAESLVDVYHWKKRNGMIS